MKGGTNALSLKFSSPKKINQYNPVLELWICDSFLKIQYVLSCLLLCPQLRFPIWITFSTAHRRKWKQREIMVCLLIILYLFVLQELNQLVLCCSLISPFLHCYLPPQHCLWSNSKSATHILENTQETQNWSKEILGRSAW